MALRHPAGLPLHSSPASTSVWAGRQGSGGPERQSAGVSPQQLTQAQVGTARPLLPQSPTHSGQPLALPLLQNCRMITYPTSRAAVNTSAAQHVSMQLGAGLHDSGGQSPCWPARVRTAVHSWPRSGRLGDQLHARSSNPYPAASPTEVPADPRAAETEGSEAPQPVLGAPSDAGRAHHRPPGSLAALGHMPEELLALLVAEAPQTVGALQVPLASLGHAEHPPSAGRSATGVPSQASGHRLPQAPKHRSLNTWEICSRCESGRRLAPRES